MGYYRGKRIPEDFDQWYETREGMEEHWYWYQFGYEDGLADDYNRKTDDEVKRLQADVASLMEQAAARERVLASVYSKLPQQELPPMGDTPTVERIEQSDKTGMVAEA